MLRVFFPPHDVTLTHLPESTKAVVLSPSFLPYSLLQNRWIWANLSNGGGCSCLLQRSTSFPNIDFINVSHAMQTSKKN